MSTTPSTTLSAKSDATTRKWPDTQPVAVEAVAVMGRWGSWTLVTERAMIGGAVGSAWLCKGTALRGWRGRYLYPWSGSNILLAWLANSHKHICCPEKKYVRTERKYGLGEMLNWLYSYDDKRCYSQTTKSFLIRSGEFGWYLIAMVWMGDFPFVSMYCEPVKEWIEGFRSSMESVFILPPLVGTTYE